MNLHALVSCRPFPYTTLFRSYQTTKKQQKPTRLNSKTHCAKMHPGRREALPTIRKNEGHAVAIRSEERRGGQDSSSRQASTQTSEPKPTTAVGALLIRLRYEQ